ncbi:MAG: aldehyde dehydrogenase [Bacteroidia bacterium]|nr:aldehyde dehydrogenase [Bacteroidia bacterium]MCX7652548.1 aldehyde dehydrogenase [Bacteroidia bacterium]MDW8417531.1 aldehyde dehydrogenase [Bacteroidia bacterium]
MPISAEQTQVVIDLSPLRTFFHEGPPKEVKVRLRFLERLEEAIRRSEKRILEALHTDLGKSDFEGYASEIGFTLDEIRYLRRHLRKWVRPKSVFPSIVQLPGRSYIRYEPRGVVLIISPWNYPFQLMMVPLAGAIAAGNVVVLKPSEFAPATAKVIEAIVREVFPPEYVQVVQGDANVSAALLELDWDYIFFTGSTRIGRVVAEAAARKLIPYTLELGGKSPVIVESDADIPVTARRVAWGKWLNAGQTCIAPDYVLVQERVFDSLVEAIKKETLTFYGDIQSPPAEYARIINQRHYDRLVKMLGEGEIVFGGYTDPSKLYISPTLILSPQGSLLEEEIFGPILPIIPFSRPEEAVSFVRRSSPPLAMYVFSSAKSMQDFYLTQLQSGGACINDTIMHIGSSRLPFGGVRESGIGRYHGWYSFETFSHARAVVKTPTWIDLPLRYPPYGKKISLIRKLLG